MSFNPALFVKLQPSTLFTQPATIPSVVPAKAAVQYWTYQAGSDSMATVEAAGYFNYFADWVQTLQYNNGQYLQVGDLIYCVCSDGNVTLTVSAVGQSITTAVYTTTYSYVSVPMTSAQWKGMEAAPFLLIPAQGAHTLITVNNFVIECIFGTTQYTSGGAVNLQYGNTAAAAGPAASATIAAATVNAWAANNIDGAAGSVPNTASGNVINTAIYITNATNPFATGDSAFVVKVYYSVARTTL